MHATRLPNGLRVLTEPMAHLRSVTMGIWVETGSRHEVPSQGGISHFLEHLFFKGTTRRTAAQIAEEIDAVGGVLNAFTTKEYTCFYAKVLPEHLGIATDLLADLFTASRFAHEEIERERSVVLQEISQLEDTPDDWIHDLFSLDFWAGHALARPIAGTVETVQGLERRELLDFLAARYRPDRVIIAAAGGVDHARLVASVERAFECLEGTSAAFHDSAPAPRRVVHVHEKPLEQLHVCLGVPGLAQSDPERYAAHLLNTAFGGGMSSRLFQEIREKRGKAYNVYSFLSSFRDTGYVGVYVGTSAAWLHEVIDVVRTEARRLARDGLAPAELERAKEQVKGSLLLGLETSDSHMSRIAKNEIYHGRDISIDEVREMIDAVTRDDIVRVAERLLGQGIVACTVLGDLQGRRLDEEVLGS